jgi:hypothetical protein
MANQVAAHGFILTQALRDCCEGESNDKLRPLALHNFGSRWALSLEGNNHVAHLTWNDGPFHGDVTIKSEDMYQSIHGASKRAMEQMKKAHSKRYDHHKPVKGFVQAS